MEAHAKSSSAGGMPEQAAWLGAWLVFLACSTLAVALPACKKTPVQSPLPQRAYVWQREWTPAVVSALRHHSPHLTGHVIFGAEITWTDGQPRAVRAAIDWAAVRALPTPVSIAMRISDFGGPFEEDGQVVKKLAATASSLLEKAHAEQVRCAEFQIDFDCAQKKLAAYARWLPSIRAAIQPVPLIITTLPTWLDEPALAHLLDQADGYVLQVHSIAPVKPAAQSLVCDVERARAWAAKAAALNRPFEIALSTYSALAGYDAQGHLLGLALDGVQPAWPAGTKIMKFQSDAPALAELVREWQGVRRPAGLKGLLWYRLPVATDVRNWRWPTFAAVMEGRKPSSHLSVKTATGNPVDLALLNDGEAEEDVAAVRIVLTWPAGTPAPVAFEGLPGWTASTPTPAGSPQIIFAPAGSQTLSPGAQRGIGWVRFEKTTGASPHVEIIR